MYICNECYDVFEEPAEAQEACDCCTGPECCPVCTSLNIEEGGTMQELIKKLEVTAGQFDKDFSMSDCSNYDDAYYAGFHDGEIDMAKSILAELKAILTNSLDEISA
jgi:hypothetical protein